MCNSKKIPMEATTFQYHSQAQFDQQGGTEAALTMLIADHARKIVGVGSYSANSFDDETGRFVEELRIYEREVGSFQFKVLDEDVINCISNLPVELDGIDTDQVEVVGHRGMKRVSTDRR